MLTIAQARSSLPMPSTRNAQIERGPPHHALRPSLGHHRTPKLDGRRKCRGRCAAYACRQIQAAAYGDDPFRRRRSVAHEHRRPPSNPKCTPCPLWITILPFRRLLSLRFIGRMNLSCLQSRVTSVADDIQGALPRNSVDPLWPLSHSRLLIFP